MGRVQTSTLLSAPLDQVFLAHKNVAKLVSFLSDSLDVETVSANEELNKGEEIEFFIGRFGIKRRCKIKVEDLAANKKIEIRQELGLFRSYRHTVRFSDHGGGKTLVEDFVSYHLPLGIIGHLIDDLYFHADLKKIIESRCKKMAAHFAELSSK